MLAHGLPVASFHFFFYHDHPSKCSPNVHLLELQYMRRPLFLLSDQSRYNCACSLFEA